MKNEVMGAPSIVVSKRGLELCKEKRGLVNTCQMLRRE